MTNQQAKNVATERLFAALPQLVTKLNGTLVNANNGSATIDLNIGRLCMDLDASPFFMVVAHPDKINSMTVGNYNKRISEINRATFDYFFDTFPGLERSPCGAWATDYEDSPFKVVVAKYDAEELVA